MLTILFVIYSGVLALGAYFGAKAKSKVSVIMATASAVISIISAILIYQEFILQGVLTGVILSGLLSVTFAIRLRKTGSFMPSGMLLIISLGVLACSLFSIF